MATAQGIDLEEEMLRGKMSIPDLEDAVLRCTGCSKPCACERFLDTVQAPIDSAPSYCRNRDLFAELSGD
ncbi:hypothetical protein J1C49_13835 [Cognatishimia sp. F0-27]|nr:hypothetical protein [Cognatishimia sp. F0-27]